MKKPKLVYYKVDELVKSPVVKTKGSACFDIPISIREGFNLKFWSQNNQTSEQPNELRFEIPWDHLVLVPGNTYLIPTGLIFEIPDGYHLQIHLRSSTGLKKHLGIPSHIGIIDSDYRDEVHIPLYVTSNSSVFVQDGDMLAQAMLVKNVDVTLEETTETPEKLETRSGGFGSTGN